MSYEKKQTTIDDREINPTDEELRKEFEVIEQALKKVEEKNQQK